LIGDSIERNGEGRGLDTLQRKDDSPFLKRDVRQLCVQGKNDGRVQRKLKEYEPDIKEGNKLKY